MSEDEYASQEEVVAAIRALSDVDHQKLVIIARFWHQQRRGLSRLGIEPEELLSEAFERTLNERRRWRKARVTLIRHLDATMRSVSGQMLAAAKSEREGLAAVHDRQPALPTLEAQVLAREEIAAIDKFFSDDPSALGVLRCRADGKDAEEIRSELDLTKTEYATICRRIVRKFIKYSSSD